MVVATILFVLSGGIILSLPLILFVEGRRLAKSKAQDDSPEVEAKRLKTYTARSIWESYESLDEEFKRFPDLFDALVTLEERSFLENEVMSGDLMHHGSCSGYYFGHFNHPDSACEACRPYRELGAAVAKLNRAQRKRELAIEDSKKASTRAELDSKMMQYQTLAEQMIAEAAIHQEVTKEVYETRND